MGLLLNDEWITANQLTNLKHGSLTVEVIKYGSDWGIYNMSGRPVGAYTHALPVFALPVYYALSAVAYIINLRLFFIFVWLLAASALIYYYSGTKRTKYVLAFLALLFFATNLLLSVYRNNTARAQLQNVTKIVGVICLSIKNDISNKRDR